VSPPFSSSPLSVVIFNVDVVIVVLVTCGRGGGALLFLFCDIISTVMSLSWFGLWWSGVAVQKRTEVAAGRLPANGKSPI